MYMFGLTPGLLHTLLPNIYWLNFCKLVRGFQIVSQHEITHEDAFEGCVLLASWEHELKEIYYQRLNDRLHFIWPCIHQVAHLGPDTFQKGPSICTAQWTMEGTISNLEYDIRQPSNYLVNFAMEGVSCAHVNALLAALLELDDTRTGCPQGAVDLGNGYALLHKQDKMLVLPSDGTMGAIFKYLNHPNPMPIVFVCNSLKYISSSLPAILCMGKWYISQDWLCLPTMMENYRSQMLASSIPSLPLTTTSSRHLGRLYLFAATLRQFWLCILKIFWAWLPFFLMLAGWRTMLMEMLSLLSNNQVIALRFSRTVVYWIYHTSRSSAGIQW